MWAPARWLSVAAVISIVVAVIISHRYLPDQISGLASSIIHSLHAPGFAAVALSAFFILRTQGHTELVYFKAGALAMILGALSEAAQIPGPRDAQFKDLIVDAIGIFGALATMALFDKEIRVRTDWRAMSMLGIAGLSALCAALLPTIWQSYALVARNKALPVLLSFEQRWETNVYEPTNNKHLKLIPAPSDWPIDQGTVARSKENGRWGHVLVLYPYPDWTEYSSVSFLAASTSETRHTLRMSVRDLPPNHKMHSVRSYQELMVGPKPVRYTIRFDELHSGNGDRQFDLKHVYAIILSAAKPGSDVQIYVDDFRLEP